jgi:hypothetical protein
MEEPGAPGRSRRLEAVEAGLQARTHRMRVLIESHSGPSRNLEPPLTDQQINVLRKALSGFEVVGSDAELILDVHQLMIREQLCRFVARDSDQARSTAEAVLSWVEQLDRPPG